MPIYLLIFILLSSCKLDKPLSIKGRGGFAKSISYVFDDRTELCYAVKEFETYGGYRIESFTNIPCSSRVENIIKEQNKPPEE